MAAASGVLRAQSAANHLWMAAAMGLVAFAAACGVAIAYGEMGAFYVALSLTLALGILYDFRMGAVLLVLMLPMQTLHLFPHSLMGVTGLNPLNIVLGATFISFIIHRGQIASLAPKELVWLYLVPIVFAAVNGVQHADDIVPFFYEMQVLSIEGPVGYLMELVVRPLLIVPIVLLVGAAIARSQKPERFIYVIGISVWVMAAIEIGFIIASGIRLNVLASPFSRRFFMEMGLHANDLGRLFAVAYALLIFPWWEAKDRRIKAFLTVTLCIATIAMILSFSRGAFLGFFVVNALFLAWKFNARSLSIALLVGVLVLSIAPGYLYNRLTMGFDADANAVSADRIEGIWLPLLGEIWKSPIWGNGIGYTLWSMPAQLGIVTAGHPHNAYLEAILDMGFVGLGLLLAYYFTVYRGFRALGSNAYLSPEMRGLFQGATAALACFAITGWVGSSLRPESEFAYLWLAIGMMYGMRARKPAG